MSGYSIGQGYRSGRGGERRGEERAGGVSALRSALRGVAEVLGPEDAEEPILAPSARVAIQEWLAENNSREEMKRAKIKPRSTVLMHGPPGCGKTTMAHHLATRLGIPLVMVGAETLISKFMGESSQRVARLFDVIAESERPCILLLDEIDAIGSKRSTSDTAASRDNNQVLTVILRKVESFAGMLIGATNLPDQLDAALWRRFAIHLAVDLPGGDERYAILCRYLEPYVLPPEVMDLLTDLTEGASPALLRGMMEGIKRSLILWPKLGKDPMDPYKVMRGVVASVRPPPEMQPPPLWADEDAFEALRHIQWPPEFREAAAA